MAELVKVDADEDLVMAPAQEPKGKQPRMGPANDQMMKLLAAVAKLALSTQLSTRVLRAAVMLQFIISRAHSIVQEGLKATKWLHENVTKVEASKRRQK